MWLVADRVGWPAFISGNERAAGDLRRQSLQILQPQQLQQADLARERGHAALLGEAKHADQETQPAAIGEEPTESSAAQRALGEGSRPVLLELGARCFDQRSVVHAGRTDRLAGAAIEALVHLLVEERIEEIESVVGDRAHQPEACPGERTSPGR